MQLTTTRYTSMKYVIQIDADTDILTLNRMMNMYLLHATQKYKIDIKEYSIMEVRNESN